MPFKAYPFFLTLLLCFSLFAAPHAARADEYATASMSNIFKTMLRLGALDIRDDRVIDLYARTNHCDLFKQDFSDDFKWQAERGKFRDEVRQNIATYPIAYRYDAVLQLDRYDFKKGFFRLTDRTAQTQTNVFTMITHAEDLCTKDDHGILPTDYRFVLDQPIHLEGLPLNAEEGDKLLKRMVQNNNPDRLIYARFNLRVVYIAPVKLGTTDDRMRKGFVRDMPMVTQAIRNSALSFDARLDSIEYYEDPARTRMIYAYRP